MLLFTRSIPGTLRYVLPKWECPLYRTSFTFCKASSFRFQVIAGKKRVTVCFGSGGRSTSGNVQAEALGKLDIPEMVAI
jgi:hypothetical protein